MQASWCGPCAFSLLTKTDGNGDDVDDEDKDDEDTDARTTGKAISPHIETLAQATPGLAFYKVDIDENEEAATAWAISAVPTFLLVKGGKVVGEVQGANLPKIKELVAKSA